MNLLCACVRLSLLLLGLAISGCRAAGPESLEGWYQLPNRHYRTRGVIAGPGTLIPVFQRAGVFYSVCRGIELPLNVVSNGLEWGCLPSSMEGTRIGRDERSGEPYLVIQDRNAQYEADWSIYGERQSMVKIRRPSGLLDPVTAPPRTIGDFVGCYIPVWSPGFRWSIHKDGNAYCLDAHVAEKQGWEPEPHESVVLDPLPGGLGFQWGRKLENRLIYHETLSRYEYASSDGRARMPLARVNDTAPPETGVPSPAMEIGIPSWH